MRLCIPIIHFQMDANQRPQHLGAELLDSPVPSLRVTASLGFETLISELPLNVSPLTGMMDSKFLIQLGQGYLNVTINPLTCNEGPDCFSSIKVEQDSNALAEVNLDEDLFVGNIPELTPYIRSKIISTSGLRGCLGVSCCLETQPLNPSWRTYSDMHFTFLVRKFT